MTKPSAPKVRAKPADTQSATASARERLALASLPAPSSPRKKER